MLYAVCLVCFNVVIWIPSRVDASRVTLNRPDSLTWALTTGAFSNERKLQSSSCLFGAKFCYLNTARPVRRWFSRFGLSVTHTRVCLHPVTLTAAGASYFRGFILTAMREGTEGDRDDDYVGNYRVSWLLVRRAHVCIPSSANKITPLSSHSSTSLASTAYSTFQLQHTKVPGRSEGRGNLT